MKLKNILALALFATAFTACETVDEDERFIGPVEFPALKNVLIEDFTGQFCINCPKAAKVTHTLQQAYGEDHVIPVAIHPSFKVMPGLGSKPALSSPLTDAYTSFWKVPDLPNGMIDRGKLSLYETWTAQAINRLQKEAQADIQITKNVMDTLSNVISVDVNVVGKTSAKAALQLWLIENGIKHMQNLPDGSMDREYTHNHVLRDTLNGMWGEPIEMKANETLSKQYTYTVKNPKWNPKNLEIVAFVFNEQEGVMQVIKNKTTLK